MPPRPLDDRIAELREDPGRTWGVGDAVLALVAVPLSFAVVGLLLLSGLDLPGAVATALASAVLAALAVLAGRRAARQSGGWQRALGLDLPEWSDSWRVLGWSLLLLLVQSAVTAGLQQLVDPLEGAVADNASFLREEPLWALLVFAVAAVAVAPVLEELLFRGLVLRGLMLRIGFWPAAVVSSAFFGVFHAQGTDPSSVLVVVATAVFGLGLCVLARRTGRLGPGIGVHALRNAVAILAATQV
jgi:membrane protease YdiL (CAAX protease family)